jgi:type VI secretion system protein
MPLYVSVVSYKGHPPVKQIRAAFDENGGTIGRSSDNRGNHLMLPDPERYISRIHAKILCEGGIYTLTDISEDGTYINGKTNRVGRDAVTLSDGDELWIGDYRLRVNISMAGLDHGSVGEADSSDPSMISVGFFEQENQPTESSPKAPPGNTDNQDWWSDGGFWETDDNASPAVDESEASPMHDAFIPPDTSEESAASLEIPQEFDFRELFSDQDDPPGGGHRSDRSGDAEIRSDHGRERSYPLVQKDPFGNESGSQNGDHRSDLNENARGSETSHDASSRGVLDREPIHRQVHRELVQHFMEAAGVKDPPAIEHMDSIEFMRTMGAVFRELIQGLMIVLNGRKELKTNLLVEATSIKPSGNNPLKFFGELDDALRQLLTGEPPGFIDTRSSVREGFTDIMHHQIAMNAGWQAALIDLIKRVDPQEFAKTHENGVVFQRKAKSWDAYQEAYQKIADEALENIFGKPFSDAYKEQIRKLRSKPE